MSATSLNNIYQPSKVPAGSSYMQETRRRLVGMPERPLQATSEMIDVAKRVVEFGIKNRFMHGYGLDTCPAFREDETNWLLQVFVAVAESRLDELFDTEDALQNIVDRNVKGFIKTGAFDLPLLRKYVELSGFSLEYNQDNRTAEISKL